MTTVREATFDFMREQGMTTVFGNPGSTELPFLEQFPDDFRYVLGLHEGVAVGVADGYAQASGRPALVNLHTAPGVGNAMGALFTAQANKSPLVVTAGQQARSLMTLQALLTNRDAARMPHPLVKWSYEPPRAEDVPHAIARATHLAALPPRGPVFVSIPMDDWRAEVDEDAVAHQTSRARERPRRRRPGARRTRSRAGSPPARTRCSWSGPTSTPAAAGTPPSRSPRRRGCRCGRRPPPAAGASASPRTTRTSAACCRPRSGRCRETLAGHDLIVVAGSQVFAYYPNLPGSAAARGRGARRDHQRPRRGRAGADGRRDRRRRQAHARGAAGRTSSRPTARRPSRAPPPTRPRTSDPMSPSAAIAALADVFPDEGIVVPESPATTFAVRNRLRLNRPGSYYFTAGGGLGFALPASIGVQMAQPERRVVCVLGEGSAQYAIQGLWTAAAYDVPVTFLVLRNEEYAILKWFGEIEQVTGAPGLDLPALDVASVAEGYGVPSTRVDDPGALREALRDAHRRADGPRLVEARVAPGMALA